MIKITRKMSGSIAFLSTFILSACSTLAPNYNKPAPPIPAAFASAKTDAANTNYVADIPWQEFFVDKKLQSTIKLALENSRDLKIAVLNMERTGAKYQIQRSDLFPKIDANASANFQRVPVGLSGRNEAVTLHQYNIGLGVASYELDLFGRVKSLKEGALEQYLATEQGKKSAQIALVSQVALYYLTLAADRERLDVAKKTLLSQREAYQLVKNRFDAGVANSLALNQAETTVESARLDVARYSAIVEQDINAINLAVGSVVPETLLPQSVSEEVAALKDISPGISSDALLKRPDILQAENLLKSYNANIAVARGAYFPRITLVSSVGFGSDELSGLFGAGGFAWSFLPKITLPIFNAGSNEAGVKVAEADRSIAVAQYEKTIQTAFKEVSDALAIRSTIDEQLSAQSGVENATKESLKISQARFDQGVENYLAVLDSQRNLYGAKQGVISLRLAKLANMVTLYKALGGGGI